MGFFSNLTRSWNKSSKLQELQKVISPPNQSISDLVRRSLDTDAMSARQHAIEQFLDLCESDDGVRKVMEIEGLSRADLEQLYVNLLANGLGWIKDHHAALSTIAYVEPLQYSVRAKKRGVGLLEIVFNLREYWEGKIPSGGLLRQVQ